MPGTLYHIHKYTNTHTHKHTRKRYRTRQDTPRTLCRYRSTAAAKQQRVALKRARSAREVAGYNFSKVSSVVIVYSKLISELSFENFLNLGLANALALCETSQAKISQQSALHGFAQ